MDAFVSFAHPLEDIEVDRDTEQLDAMTELVND